MTQSAISCIFPLAYTCIFLNQVNQSPEISCHIFFHYVLKFMVFLDSISAQKLAKEVYKRFCQAQVK